MEIREQGTAIVATDDYGGKGKGGLYSQGTG